MKTIGVISDTHGLLRPKALAVLEGSDLIVHAGDIGSPDIIEALRAICPVVAVRGNMDTRDWAARFPATDMVEVEGCCIYVLHDLNALDLDIVAAGIQVVISGHSHRPSITSNRGVLYLNPGSAGPRRFHLPVTLAKLVVRAGEPVAEIVDLSGA